jgi:hypothetical protein
MGLGHLLTFGRDGAEVCSNAYQQTGLPDDNPD